MGTRSLTFVYEKYGEVQKPVCNMYRQFDGYPTGHGAELVEFLNGGRLVNGLIYTETVEEIVFNGMGCLAASMVAHFKESPGGFYIHPTDVTDCGQDYEYHIYNKDGLYIEVYNCGCNFFGMSGDKKELEFGGYLKDFAKFCSDKDESITTTQKNVFDGSKIGKDWLKSVLRDGVAVVKFEKNDGTERVMKCTLKRDLVPQEPIVEGAIKKTKTHSPDVLPVYDVEVNGWRSFRWDSIKSVEIS